MTLEIETRQERVASYKKSENPAWELSDKTAMSVGLGERVTKAIY